MFSTLCEFAVPMTKAAWFIKMFAAYNVAVQEKMKQRRQLVDQAMGKVPRKLRLYIYHISGYLRMDQAMGKVPRKLRLYIYYHISGYGPSYG